MGVGPRARECRLCVWGCGSCPGVTLGSTLACSSAAGPPAGAVPMAARLLRALRFLLRRPLPPAVCSGRCGR